MRVFDQAWDFLKALPEQQLETPYGRPIKTMHPAIEGLIDRKLDWLSRNWDERGEFGGEAYNSAYANQYPKVTNLSQIQNENMQDEWPEGYDADIDAEYQGHDKAWREGYRDI